MTDALTLARRIAADKYPASITDTMNREHESIPRKAILSGHWDQGSIVQSCLKEAEDLLRKGEVEEE